MDVEVEVVGYEVVMVVGELYVELDGWIVC